MSTPLETSLNKQGNFCFRYRSFLPILLIPTALLAIALGDRWFERQDGWVELAWNLTIMAVAVAGFITRFWVIGYASDGTSGRNTTEQIADALNTTGLYSLCRNPLYWGNFLIWGALAMMTESFTFVSFYILVFALFYERILLCEEHFLLHQFGASYQAWASRTPAFWPKLSGYIKPRPPFSLKRVLRKEYPGVINFALLACLMEVTLEYSEHLEWELSAQWQVLVAGFVLLGLCLRTMRKYTSILR